MQAQVDLAAAAASALAAAPWHLHPAGSEGLSTLFGACFVAFARGEAGPGQVGDRAWASAVTWRRSGPRGPAERRAGEREGIEEEAVITGTTGAPYIAGLLALREGPLLGTAVGALARPPDVLLVDATGLDHPRRAGLAVHMGAHLNVPTIGVTHRPLLAEGAPPVLRRGATAPLFIGSQEVGSWVCTRNGARPVVAHAAWRTDPATAVEVVLAASSAAARAPVPLREARRAAREARAMAEGRTSRAN